MAKIRSLFDKNRPIDRRIEKVIQYQSSDSELLKKEISEYVATASIEESFYRLLTQIDDGMSGDREHEIGIWVSGFYGSGKSSFTKYLGLALDPNRKLEKRPFREWLNDRFQMRQTKALLNAVAQKHPLTVVMLDLSTDTLTGTTMLPVSTVVYYKVLDWAGYSREKKLAYFELMLDRDEKWSEFDRIIKEISGGEKWAELRNDLMAAATFVGQAACRLYPNLWPTPEQFDRLKIDEIEPESVRVRRMLEIIERRTGSRNVLFVLDEVGQYVAPDDDRITNLQGLAQNLKHLGQGRAWIVATAQQTLTEDDTRAALNTPKLFKLKDRFAIAVDLEASDIREICYRRLLSKSPEGEKLLENLYARHGEKLRHCTRIEGARGYSAELDKKAFVDLYPFLPVHFDILLRLLGRLAKTTSGVGLRSAIKVIQDSLIEGAPSGTCLADRETGTLANTVSLFDTLRVDIEKSFRHVIDGVRQAQNAFRDSPIHSRVAKSVAVLQILEDFPLTRENLAALIHERADGQSELVAVKKAVDELIDEPTVPLSEVDGKLRFMSKAVIDLEQRRREYFPGQSEERIILNGILNSIFYPQPTARIHDSKTVGCGLKLVFSGHQVPIFGDKEEIQIVLDLLPESVFTARRGGYLDDSRLAAAQKTIFAIGKRDPEIDDLVVEIYRSDKIAGPGQGQTIDKEIEDYKTGQKQRAEKLKAETAARIKRGILGGAFIYQGRENAVKSLDAELLAAARKQVGEAGERIFEKYAHAPVQADGALAERFLKTRDLTAVTAANDPLELTRRGTSRQPVNTAHPALIDLKDYLDLNGTVDGRKLLDDFSRSPYGWSKDTTRYLVAALLAAGVVKLRVSNQDITVRTEAGIEALKNVANFNKAGIGLQKRPDDWNEWLVRAAERLLPITGEQVLPLEENIIQAVLRCFPDLQTEVAPLPHQLKSLHLAGIERAERLQRAIRDLIAADAEAANRLGTKECELYEDILWARKVLKALKNGADDTIARAQSLRTEISGYPDEDLLILLKESTKAPLAEIEEILRQEDCFERLPELQGHVSAIQAAIQSTAEAMERQQQQLIEEQKSEIVSTGDWKRIGEEDRGRFLDSITQSLKPITRDTEGIRNMMLNRYLVLRAIDHIRDGLAERTKAIDDAEKRKVHSVTIAETIDSAQKLDEAVAVLTSFRDRLEAGESIRIILG